MNDDAAPAGRPLPQRIAGFLLVPVLTILTSLTLFAVLARAVGTAEWTALAIGQSLGSSVGIVASCGWTLSGPNAVARAQAPALRAALYEESLRQRILVLAVLTPPLIAVACLLGRSSDASLTAFAAWSAALAALSPAWYCVGRGRPSDLLRFDTGPRLLATLAAAVAIALGAPAVTYPAVVAAAALLATGGFSIAALKERGASMDWQAAARRLPSRSRATATETLGAMYSNASTALVSVRSSTVTTATFAAALRLYQPALLFVVAFSSSFQSWVVRGGRSEERRRAILALAAHAAVGGAGGVGMALLMPWVSTRLFTDDYAVPVPVAWWLGFAFLGVSLNTCLGRLILIPADDVATVLRSTAVGTILGVPLLVGGSAAYAATGAAAAVAVSQAVVCLVQAGPARRVLGATVSDRVSQ